MKRRKFTIGLGAITTGAAAALGTSAFTAAQISDRDADIAVVDDSNALIGLVPNPDVSGVHDDDGELTIDLAGDGNGINQGAVYQFGTFADDDAGTVSLDDDSGFPFTEDEPSARNGDDEFGSAFLVANQTDSEQTLEVVYEVDSDDDISTEFIFEAHNDGERRGIIDADDDITDVIDLDPGEAFGVSFLLFTPPDEDTLGEEISGSLSVRAGEAVD